MKNLFLVLIAISIAGCSASRVRKLFAVKQYYNIHSMLNSKDFFAARDKFQNTKTKFTKAHSLTLSAGIDNAFNKPSSSNTKIKELLEDKKLQLNDSVKLELLELKQANHGRLFEYTEAAATINLIISQYSHILAQEQIDDHKNTLKIWNALKGKPKQEIIIGGDTRMKMSRDKANLANLEVKAGDISIDFIFDTGANISTVTRSTAKQFNMDIIEAAIEVGSITGAKVNSALAVCPEMKIGNITVKNAVFLVFDDTALAFPQIGYQINGILGFPVIEAMKEVQITTDDEFIVPEKQSTYHTQNMALDFLTPVIQIGRKYYTFDTGATHTSLYTLYYYAHRTAIEEKYTPKELEFGGACGMKTMEGYSITFNPVIDGKTLSIEDVQLYTKQFGEKDRYYYGNIGQDLIKQFSKMTINFESMFIKFD